MGRAIVVRTDYTSGDVRRIAQRLKNAAQARRLLAIAAALDGSSRDPMTFIDARWQIEAAPDEHTEMRYPIRASESAQPCLDVPSPALRKSFALPRPVFVMGLHPRTQDH